MPGVRVGCSGLDLHFNLNLAGVLEFLGSFTAEELARAAEGLAWPCPDDEAALLQAAWPAHAAVVVAALGRGLENEQA